MAKKRKTIKDAEETIASTRSWIREKRSNRLILCSCGKRHAINKLELLVTHWYVEPYSCSGGDYWKEGEWRFSCPATGVRNRLMFDDYDLDWKDRDRVGAEVCFKNIYRGLFKNSHNTYRDDETGKTYNNYNVDRNRERFELPAKRGN
jgi:hypothetical protein